MGYLQALNLMVKAYKAARGVMPKGLDLLKLKMKARQKVIDSKKVIEFPKERITNPFKPRPRSESEAQMLARMNKQNKESAARLRNKKEVEKSLQKLKDSKKPQKTLKDLLDEYKGDPDAMAEGGVASAIKKIKKRFGKKSITTGNKIKRPGNRQLLDDFKKRNKFNNGGPIDPSYLGIPQVGLGTGSRPGGHPYPSLDYYDDDAGVKGLMKKRKKKKKKREKKATGGLANISQTYDNNPTLQSQYPNKQDYLDLFSSTTTTTPQTQTYTQMTQQSPAGIPAVKPIVPIVPQTSDDSGGITTIKPRTPKEPLTFRESMAKLNLERGVPVEEEEISFFDKIKGLSPTYQFIKAGKQKLDDFLETRAREKAIKEAQEKARLADELARQMNAVYYDNPGADFTGGRYDGASSRSEYESNPTGFSGSS